MASTGNSVGVAHRLIVIDDDNHFDFFLTRHTPEVIAPPVAAQLCLGIRRFTRGVSKGVGRFLPFACSKTSYPLGPGNRATWSKD
jgi:hypothetical protein